MRILFLSSELVPERAGGIASYTATIAPALAARGHDVHVLSCAPEHDRRDDVTDGVTWHRRPLLGGERASNAERYPQTATRLATAISCRRELARLGVRFDVMETPEWMAPSLLIGATTRLPIVVNLHTPLNILFSFDVRRFGTDLRIADRLERLAVRQATIVTSTSELLKRTLTEKGWLRRAARIVRLPVDPDAWDVGSVEETGPNVLVVGRLEPRKAPQVVVEAAELLATDIPGLRLTFAGRSRGYRERRPYGEWVAELAERRGVHARFVDQVPHQRMRELYSDARVVAVPSRFESFSVSAAEAMACGRPLVYSSRIGAAEILRDDRAGTEVPPDDAHAMAEALRPFLLDAAHASKVGSIAKDVVRTHCSLDIIAEQRERCFEEALTVKG